MRHASRVPSIALAPDTSRWPTLAEAAVILGTNERTVRRWIDAGRIHSALRPAAGRRPFVIVDPEDVERLRIRRQPVLIRSEWAGSVPREDVFCLEEGRISLHYPSQLSPESYEDLVAWLDIVKRKIGRTVKASVSTVTDPR